MNTEADFSDRSWKAPNKLKPAQPIIVWRIGLVAFLVADIGLAASAQSFTNLDFENTTLIPLTGDPYNRLQFGPALPGWTGYCGTNVQTAVNYDTQFLDSAGISILDTNYTVMGGILHRRYCVLLQTGASLNGSGAVATAIAQTGTVPANAKSILFSAGPVTSSDLPPPPTLTLTNVVVTFDGTPVAFEVEAVISGMYPIYYVSVAGNISPFAGQTGELRFTAYGGNVGLDYIRFSSSPPSQAPRILSSPSGRTANLGSTVDLDVSATGGQPLAYQWVFDGTNALSRATSAELQLVNVQLSQSGIYSVIVTNAMGSVTSSPAMLTVGFTPTILAPPQAQTTELGSVVGLAVKANGAPPPAYQWFLNGTSALSGGTNSFLDLTNVQASEAGAYTVVVSNLFGAITSNPAMLSLIPPVPRRTVPAIGLACPVGTSVHLGCADTPCPTASWQELGAVTLTSTQQRYPDLTDPLPSSRFYRAWQTSMQGLPPVLDLSLATELTLTGLIGSHMRVDYINQFGPTDAWVTLDTVSLTNTTQPYFDFSMFRQTARLYRLMLVP